MDFASSIREARLEAGLTQVDLAERSGTSQATLSAYEHGHKVPSARTLERILAASGYRIRIENGARPLRFPPRAAQEKVARGLHDVLELAAALPSRPRTELRFPRLRSVPSVS